MAKLNKFKIFLTSIFGFFVFNEPVSAQDNDAENTDDADSSAKKSTLKKEAGLMTRF